MASAPNQKWAGDISYIWTREGWVCLAVMLDLRSRRVIGWAISNRLKQDLAIRAPNMAIALRKPPEGFIQHTDRGSQYCAHDYQKILRRHGLVASMSGTGNCYDNSAVESFFKTVKAELVWRRNWQTRREVEAALFEYINGFYNPRRKHSALGWKRPSGLRTKGRINEHLTGTKPRQVHIASRAKKSGGLLADVTLRPQPDDLFLQGCYLGQFGPHPPVPGKGRSRRRGQLSHPPAQNAFSYIEITGGLGNRHTWIEDYNDNHPHSRLKMRSPREFITARTATASFSTTSAATGPSPFATRSVRPARGCSSSPPTHPTSIRSSRSSPSSSTCCAKQPNAPRKPSGAGSARCSTSSLRKNVKTTSEPQDTVPVTSSCSKPWAAAASAGFRRESPSCPRPARSAPSSARSRSGFRPSGCCRSAGPCRPGTTSPSPFRS